MATHMEVQVIDTDGGSFGCAVTITTPESEWRGPLVPLSATTPEDALIEAQAQADALAKALNGGER